MKVKSESEVVQSCLTPSDPMDCSPPGSSIHGIFQTSVLEWGAIAFSKQYMQCAAKSLIFLGHIWDPRILHVHLLCAILSRVQFFVTHDCSPSGSSIHGISMGFSRQEYWSGVPLPSPLKCSTWMQSQKQQNDLSVCFQGKPFNIMVIQVYAPTSNAEEAEVEWFYEDLHDFLELTPKKDIFFIIEDWNAKV